MALVLKDRVKETTTTTGAGTITLAGAALGYQSFAIIGNTNTTYYCIAAQTISEWEVGIGTYTAAGTTLARTTVFANSAGTQPAALTFSAGIKDVFCTYPSEIASGNVASVTGTAPVVSSGGTTPAISLAAAYGDTQNPYAAKTANFVLAGPTPSFRALVAGDMPNLTVTVTAVNYVILSSDSIIQATAAATTMTLPTAVGNLGKVFSINNASIGSITVNTTAGQFINGVLAQSLPADSTMQVYSDSIGWHIT